MLRHRLALGFALLLVGCLTNGTHRGVIDRTADPRLPTAMRQGLFLTTARIADRQAGPFLIDSGASVLSFDVKVADALDLKLWGEAYHPESNQKVKFGRVPSLQVGPLALRNADVMVMDFSAVTPVLGERLAGLLGYPFFAKAVVEVDYAKASVSCFDPEHYRLPRGEWQPLIVRDNRPGLPARIDDRAEGVFVLDTGSTVTAVIFPEFVQKYEMLEKRKAGVTPSLHFQMGGGRDVLVGEIASFELAGHRFEHPVIGFGSASTSATQTSRDFDGVIGYGFLREFIVVFNYPVSKIALLRR